MTSITFIVNPISGTKDKQKILDLIATEFPNKEYIVKILRTEYAGHAEQLAREEAAKAVQIVVAVGGDGTVNEVARGLVHSDSALGIIPCGSGNGLARHLGLSMKPKKSIDILKRLDIRECDYGKICGHPFFCTAGIGFDAEVSDTFAHAGKRGLATYVKTTLSVGMKYKGAHYDITIENNGKKEVLKNQHCWLITAANAAQYGNDFYICPQASVCDGKMDINIWSMFGKVLSPIVGARLATGTIDHDRHVRIVRCDRMTIHRSEEGPIQWDGDPANGPRDIVIESVNKGIKMVVGNPTRNRL